MFLSMKTFPLPYFTLTFIKTHFYIQVFLIELCWTKIFDEIEFNMATRSEFMKKTVYGQNFILPQQVTCLFSLVIYKAFVLMVKLD